MLKVINGIYNKHKKLFVFLIVLAIGLFFSFWLIKPGIINGHDMTFHMSRIKGIRDSIRMGDFRALVHNGFYGYGYANGIFYGNLSLYIPALISLLGVNFINSYKIYVLLSTIASAFTMYICMKSITKSNKAGIIASFLYSAASYKMTDFIIRAAVGEIGAFVFVPLVVLGIYEIIYGDNKKWWIFTIGFVGLVQCHLISTILVAVAMVILIVFNYDRFIKEKSRFLQLILSAIVGLLIGAHFILPLLEGLMRNTMIVNLNSFPIWNYTVPFEKLFLGFPYYAWDKSPFLPGGIGLVYIIITIFRFKINTKKDERLIKFCDFSLIIAIIFLLCATDLFPWKELTKLQSVQFPWRLYLISTLFFTISSSIIAYYYLKGKTAKDLFKFILPIIILGMIPYFTIERYHRSHSNGGIMYNWDDYTVAGGEYLPQGTDIEKIKERGEIVTSNNDIKIKFNKTGLKVDVSYSDNSYENTYIEVPLLYYYGYHAIDNNGNEYEIGKGDNNVVRVYLTKEKGNVKVYYKGTKIQKLSGIISMLSTIILVIYIFRSKIFKRFKNEKRKD